jgi:hypothetical protein
MLSRSPALDSVAPANGRYSFQQRLRNRTGMGPLRLISRVSVTSERSMKSRCVLHEGTSVAALVLLASWMLTQYHWSELLDTP